MIDEIDAGKKLLRAGFIKSKLEKEFIAVQKKSGKSLKDYIDSLDKKEIIKYADQEYAEHDRLVKPIPTGFPSPLVTNKNQTVCVRLHLESFNLSIEELYYWILHHVRQDWSFSNVYKISDVFSAAEQSAFFGTAQQRLGIQQDRAAQYLKYIADMLKALFQVVREARILDERLTFYNDVQNDIKDKKNAAAKSDIVLKGIWIDMVEGGTKNPASVYGMSQQVGFVTLPDLFFRTYAKTTDDIDRMVKPMQFNEKVKEVLSRKLMQYITWRDKTYRELSSRKTFTLKYIKQHYLTIRLYLNWIKPYLRNIKRMIMPEKMFQEPEMIGAFETSMMELEFLAHRAPVKSKIHHVIVASFDYRTIPQMSYTTSEGYQQRGPIHIGKVVINLRGYLWTKEQIAAYRKMKEEEDLELLASIDETVKQTLESLGDDLKKYLEESGEIFKKEEPKKEEKRRSPSIFEPFTSIAKGFGEMGSAFIPEGILTRVENRGKPTKEMEDYEFDQELSGAEGSFVAVFYNIYKNLKKSHGYLSW